MKRIMFAVALLCGVLGCEKRPPTQEEKAIAASRTLIAALATNASVPHVDVAETNRNSLFREVISEMRISCGKFLAVANWRMCPRISRIDTD